VREIHGIRITADSAEKHKLVEIVVLNFSLEAESLVPAVRKPFDMLVEGLKVPSSRSNKTPVELFLDLAGEVPGTLLIAPDSISSYPTGG